MKVIPYRRKYHQQLLNLNKSLVDTWFKLHNDQVKKSDWTKLTPLERYLHGGPWNDPTTLTYHINEMLKIGRIDLIVDSSDNLLGEIEYHQNDGTCHIDWMMSHPDFRKKGLGSKLLDHVKQFSKSKKMRSIWTEPEDEVEYFYKKNNFELISPHFQRYTKEIEDPNSIQEWDEFSPNELNRRHLKGEVNNTSKYLEMLLKTHVKYAELFEMTYPLRKLDQENFQLYLRKIPNIKKKYSVCLVNEDNESFNLENIEQYLSWKGNYYFTNLGKLNTPWKHESTIKRMVLNL